MVTAFQNPARETTAAPLSLRRNFSITVLGNLLYAACQWAMVVAIARMGTPQMVGQYALAQAITGPIFVFSSLKLRWIQATDAKRDFAFNDYLNLRIATSVVSFLIVCLMMRSYPAGIAWILLVFSIVKVFEWISDIIYGYFQLIERMHTIAISLVLKGVVGLAALFFGLAITHSLLRAMLCYMLASLFIFIAYDLRMIASHHHSLRLSFTFERNSPLARLAWLALPAGFSVLMMSLYVNVPRYCIIHFLDESALGRFTAVSYFMIAIHPILAALSQAASPRLAQYYAGFDLESFDRLLIKLLGSGFTLGVIGLGTAIVYGGDLLAFFYGDSYRELHSVFIWLSAATLVQYSYVYLGSAFNAMRAFRLQSFLEGIGLFITVIISFYFTSSYGIRGTAMALFYASVIYFLFYMFLFVALRRAAFSRGYNVNKNL